MNDMWTLLSGFDKTYSLSEEDSSGSDDATAFQRIQIEETW